ncbi:PDDEXK nuclease domain-containing protein [Desulfosarcina sp. OttesenSCG-928-A07]|nr:PDDEXK nuclease domain-containing protein [Desulfosarcina sp. OttesenSCG-928-G17]MDL2328287.1 PDDEXK nuclease domain-containing protein [Desulfosarcina sp. OttesenSCG-928-A07]
MAQQKDPAVLPESNSKIYEGIRTSLTEARKKAFSAINSAMVAAYWEIGRQINEAVGDRADYGKKLLAYLSGRLAAEFGKGFTVANLRNMRQFYQTFPIRYALRSELTWTHYRMLMRITDLNRREFYLSESAGSGWTSRQLERQINSFYYERLLATQKEHRPEIESEIFRLEPKKEAEYILKDPYILEFLDLQENAKYNESELEQGLIDKLQAFLLELGKGFSFVARQKRITTVGGEHYYIDLVFYNYILKCFVVIDLKAGKLSYQDIGQIDFYVRLFNDKVKQENDNPTIGIILCTDKDESIVKYSVLADNENLFASKYRLYLPTEEELRAELQREREFLEWQIAENNGAGQ